MPTRLSLSGRCFECRVERIAPDGAAWIVKTTARRYFRLDAASTALLRRLMALDRLDFDDPLQASAAGFLQRRLVPLGIYAPVDAPGETAAARTTGSGTMRWQRQLLASRHVRPLAAAVAPLLSAWLLLPLLALCLWIHAGYALYSVARIGYHDLLSFRPDELLLLVAVAGLRGLLHELGHAAACWRLTRSVGAIGFGVFMGTPVLYCDVSDIHLLPRRRKALVGLAGTAMDLLVLALWAQLGGESLTAMKIYWLSIVAVLMNLLPFYRNDGYWVINDLAGSSDLLKQSLAAARAGRARVSEWAMLAFTAACVLLLIVLAALFATEFGPQQVVESGRLLPQFSGVVLALVTTLQYAALVFGIAGAVRALQRAVFNRYPSST